MSDIWIVDNGTDKVYQYAAAASRTSGSQMTSATFALAAGNTNPQDIADPPAGDSVPLATSVMAPLMTSKSIDSAFSQISGDCVRTRVGSTFETDRANNVLSMPTPQSSNSTQQSMLPPTIENLPQ